MTALRLRIPDKLVPLFVGPADVRGAKGGRGSAKTRTFAKMTAAQALRFAESGISGVILCGRQYQNSLLESSMAEVKQAIREEPDLVDFFDIGEEFIRTKDGRVSYTFRGMERNVDSLKSTARILLAWVDEAENVLESTWTKLIPTIREDASELWVTWNPERKSSATNKRFGNSKDPLIRVVEMNWRDNPWFTSKLNRDRLRDYAERPDDYDHVWEGAYKTHIQGAYFTRQLTAAKAEGRITKVARDPLFQVRVFCDLGGTGASADSFAAWPVQFIRREVRVLSYYEAQGQDIGEHIGWLHRKGYTPGATSIWLPHDGTTQDRVSPVSFESAFRGAEYATEVTPNQGAGAAMQRIEALRALFPRMWFNDDDETAIGLDVLSHYAEKRDDKRDVGLGPNHDWASHGADAMGLCAIRYEEPRVMVPGAVRRVAARRPARRGGY